MQKDDSARDRDEREGDIALVGTSRDAQHERHARPSAAERVPSALSKSVLTAGDGPLCMRQVSFDTARPSTTAREEGKGRAREGKWGGGG